MATYKYRDMHYPSYFAPEIKSIINNDFRQKHKYDGVLDSIEQKIPENFYENRRLGENDSLLCKIIRKDSVEEFVSFVQKNNIQLGSLIQSSIYETNRLLLHEQYRNDYEFCDHKVLTIIAYATIVGSNNIFQYLLDNGVKLDSSLLKFSVYGNNINVIKILEENKFVFKEFSVIDSIKCHHDYITNYLMSRYTKVDSLYFSIKYHNYMFINTEEIKNTAFYYLCRYDYPSFAKIIQQEYSLNINQDIIF